MVENCSESSRPPSSFHLLLGSFVATALLIVLACYSFEPRWETNDDVAMSMVAHGYGLAAIQSPNLVFSNVLWGYLVRSIPEVGGVLGYSVATLGVLVIVGTSITYGLIKLGLGYLATLAALALILIRPILFPQFTINAGLLMVGAIICWQLFARDKDRRALAIGCVLAFLSYLVRSQEFLLVLFVALPLLPWRTLVKDRAPKIAVFVLVLAIAISALVDRQAYLGDDWRAFNELNLPRAAITDFGAGGSLRLRPDILERHGYSSNDISLIQAWFFVDPNIANPAKLKAMVDELGPLPSAEKGLANAWVGVTTLWHPILLPSVMAALLLAFLRPSWMVVGGWGLCIATVFAFGFMGRPGVLRVYVPLVSLLLIAPFISYKLQLTGQTTWRRWLETGLLFLAAIPATSAVFAESNQSQLVSGQVRIDLENFPRHPVIVWGAAFPFEAAYPVLRIPPQVKSFQLYGLGVFTLAPFSVPYAEALFDRGMVPWLLSDSGADIFSNGSPIGLLEAYCIEHHHGTRLVKNTVDKVSRLTGSENFRCQSETFLRNSQQSSGKEN